MNYEKDIREIIFNIMTNNKYLDELDIDTMLRSVGFTSINFVRLIIEIENKFNIEFPEDKLDMTQSGTIRELCKIISSLVI